jgi:hypothetical protein
MKIFLLILALAGPVSGQGAAAGGIPPRQLVPLQVMGRARVEAQKLMDETVKGNFKEVINRMHPGYVKAISRPYGGPQKYKETMLKMMKEMGGSGIAIQAGITRDPQTAFEVDWGPREVLVDGKPVLDANGKPKQEFAFRQWMVYVPTVMDVFMKNEKGIQEKRRHGGFQIAISPKRNENWTFINGATVTPLELRKVFPFLPKDPRLLKFPAVGRPKVK